MTKAKIKLSEKIVKYIFPGLHPSVASGEDGWIVYDFDKQIPKSLGIVIPTSIGSSNYNQVFPKTFEEYFVDLSEAIAHFSRLIEAPVIPSIRTAGVEAIVGSAILQDESEYTIFRFDELVEPAEKKYLLCRMATNSFTVNKVLLIVNADPIYMEEASGIDDNSYIYWISPLKSLFAHPNEVFAAILSYAGFCQ